MQCRVQQQRDCRLLCHNPLYLYSCTPHFLGLVTTVLVAFARKLQGFKIPIIRKEAV